MAEFCLNILLTLNIYYMMRLAFQGLLSAPNKQIFTAHARFRNEWLN